MPNRLTDYTAFCSSAISFELDFLGLELPINSWCNGGNDSYQCSMGMEGCQTNWYGGVYLLGITQPYKLENMAGNSWIWTATVHMSPSLKGILHAEALAAGKSVSALLRQ